MTEVPTDIASLDEQPPAPVGAPPEAAMKATENADIQGLLRAIESLAAALMMSVASYPKAAGGEIPAALMPDRTRMAIINAGNTLEYALRSSDEALLWAKAKVLTWCAAEANWRAQQ